MSHKYAIGDIVLLHSNPDDMRQECWVEAMDQYAGCLKVIDGYRGKDYTLKDCDDGPTWQDGKWHWSEKCFDGLAMYPSYDTVAKKLCLVYGRMVNDKDQMLIYYLDGSGVHNGGSFEIMRCPYAKIPKNKSYWVPRDILAEVTMVIEERPAVTGDYILTNAKKGYSFSKPNIPLKVNEVIGGMGTVIVRDEDHFVNTDAMEKWAYSKDEYTVIDCIKLCGEDGEIIWKSAGFKKSEPQPQEKPKARPFEPYWVTVSTGRDSSHYAYVYALGGITKDWPLCYDPGASAQHDGNGTISTDFIPDLRIPPNHSMYYPPSDVTRVEFVPNRSGRTPKVGDFIRLKDTTYSFDTIGKILPICRVDSEKRVWVRSTDYFSQKVFHEGGDNEWCYLPENYELLDTGTEIIVPTSATITIDKTSYEIEKCTIDFLPRETARYIFVYGPQCGTIITGYCDEMDKHPMTKRLL